MPGKSAAKKPTPATETARPARTAAPRVSTAKHRTKQTAGAPTAVEAVPESSSEVIASLAYGYWESRGCQGGDPVEDWLRAEKEYFSAKTLAATA